jgi:hypothetical protein
MSKGKRFAQNKKAKGPIAASLALLVLTLGVTLVCTNWMGSLPSIYASAEKIEVVAVEVNLVPQGWQLNVLLKNTGSADAAIDNLQINGKISSTLGVSTNPDLTAGSYHLGAGSTGSIQVSIPTGTRGCSSGSMIEIKLTSVNGWGYMKIVSLT